MDVRLKSLTGRAALAAALLVLAAPFSIRATETRMTEREDAVLTEVNRIRADHGLPALHADIRLVRAARGHSTAMVSSQTFAHGNFWVRIEQQGIRSGRLGETLGWSAPVGGSVDRIVSMWLTSPEHRAIVLSPVYRAVGIGISIGPFMHRPQAVVVTADYLGPVT